MAPKRRMNGLSNSRSRETSTVRDIPSPATTASKKTTTSCCSSSLVALPQQQQEEIPLQSKEQMHKWTKAELFRSSPELTEIFSAPTKIYHLLSIRHRFRPIFLHRTLTFMKHKLAKRRRPRSRFSFEEFAKSVAESNKRGKFPKPKFMTITFLGYFDSSYTTTKTIKVDTSIVKSRNSRRKEPSQKTTLSLFTGEVPVNPKDDECPQVPIISISPDTFSSVQNGSDMFYTLGVRVTRDPACIDEDSEVKSVTLEGFLQVFDNKKCVLLDGLYDVRLRNSKDRPLRATVWIPIDGLPTSKDDSEDIAKGPMISFRLEWTNSPSSGWVERPKLLPEPPGKKHSQKQMLPVTLPCGNLIKMRYHFVQGQSQISTDTLSPYQCPWCDLKCGGLYPLLKHQRLSHSRFKCVYTELGPKSYLVDVVVDPQFASSCIDGHDGMIRAKFEGPRKRTVVTELLVCRPKRSSSTLSEFFDSVDRADKELQRPNVTGHNRVYHHTKTCLPIQLNELDEDSEGEKDPEWLKQKTISMIDDFTDVNEGEKEVMKMWNLHVLKRGYVGDCQIPIANAQFVDAYGDQIIKQNLYRNFILHLSNQFDFGLLSATKMLNIILQLQKKMFANKEEIIPTMATHWAKQREEWLRSGGPGGTQDHADKPFLYQKPKELLQNNPKIASSSTFISHDGTLRRKMSQQQKQSKSGSCNGNVSGNTRKSTAAAVKDVKDSRMNTKPISSNDKRKVETSDSNTRKKRKLSLQEATAAIQQPAKRKRSESVPDKPSARKTTSHNTVNNTNTDK